MKTDSFDDSKKMPEFSNVFETVERTFKHLGQKGVALAGETNEAWIFKPQINSGQEMWASVIVSKKDGKMHFPNMLDPEDDKVIYNAKIIYP